MRSLNVCQAADLLGLSPDTVRRLADSGQITYYRLPSGYRRFDAADVVELLRQLRRRQERECVPAK